MVKLKKLIMLSLWSDLIWFVFVFLFLTYKLSLGSDDRIWYALRSLLHFSFINYHVNTCECFFFFLCRSIRLKMMRQKRNYIEVKLFENIRILFGDHLIYICEKLLIIEIGLPSFFSFFLKKSLPIIIFLKIF